MEEKFSRGLRARVLLRAWTRVANLVYGSRRERARERIVFLSARSEHAAAFFDSDLLFGSREGEVALDAWETASGNRSVSDALQDARARHAQGDRGTGGAHRRGERH